VSFQRIRAQHLRAAVPQGPKARTKRKRVPVALWPPAAKAPAAKAPAVRAPIFTREFVEAHLDAAVDTLNAAWYDLAAAEAAAEAVLHG
jgi:hypothetical protein